MKQWQSKDFGEISGQKVTRYTLENDLGDQADFMEYGAALISLKMVGEDGNRKDIVLGYDSLDEYRNHSGNLGAVCGRYANRIRYGEYRLNDVFYRVPKNDGSHACHSGKEGFHTRVWQMEDIQNDSITFVYVAKDGETGFPGELTCKVTYTFDDDRALSLTYHAVSSKDTVINLTNHSYFNLAGEGDIRSQLVEVNASFMTPVDAELIPTGEILQVEGTDFDLRQARKLATILDSSSEAISSVGGLDHNYIIDAEERGELRYAARLINPESHMQLVCYTTEPGVQVYTANNLKDYPGSDGRTFGKHKGICFETQHFPDSPNVTYFPSPVLKAGEEFTSQTIYSYVPYADF